MIFDRFIGFLDELEIDVDVTTQEGISVGRGTLAIKEKSMPKVSFDFYTSLLQFSNEQGFICKANGFTYQLIDCDVSSNLIYPSFIVKGKEYRHELKKVNLLFQGLSQWMGTNNQIDINESEIIKKRESKLFEVEIEVDGKSFLLSNEYWCEVKQLKANNNQINEYTILTIEAINCTWTLLELTEIINQIRTFFSLLLGHSIGLEYLLDDTCDGMKQSIYIPNATNRSDNDILFSDCFVNSNRLFEDEKWELLLKNYFNIKNDKYRNLWARVSGMFSYEGFWEHRILAYVSLLDRYVDLYAEDKTKSISDKQFRKSRRVAKEALEKTKLSHHETDESKKKIFDAVIDSMKEQITNTVKNKTIASFREKLQLAKNEAKEIIRVLGLDEDAFNHLIKVRDHVAHGSPAPVKTDKNITYESEITNKLALLLLYWVFKDIGFSRSEFLSNLRHFGYPLIRKARINNAELDSLMEDHIFIDVSKSDFEDSKKRKAYLVFNYLKKSNTFHLNEKYSESIRQGLFDEKSRGLEVHKRLTSLVDNKEVKNIVLINSLYFKDRDRLYKAPLCCILNCPEYICSRQNVNKQMIIFDSKLSEWIEK